MTPARHIDGVNPSTALRTGARLLWERSASVLPVYLLASGLYGAARAPLVVAAVAAVWLLAAAGRLDPFLDRLRAAEGGPIDPGTGAGPGSGSLPPELGDAVAGLLTPGVVLLLVGGALGAAVLAVLASAVGNAAAVGGLVGLLRGDDGVRAAVTGVRRHWRAFVGVRLLLLAAIAVVLTPLFGLVAAVIGVTADAGGLTGVGALGIVAAVLGGLVTLLAVLVVLVLFAFADQAVVVDDIGAVAGVKRSLRLPLQRPTAVLGYVAVAIGAVLVSAVVGSLAATAGAPRAAALAGTILVPPVVDGFKTALYAETELPAESETAPPIGTRLRMAFGGGLRSAGAFVRDHPLATLASLGCFAAGGAVGWIAARSTGVNFPIGGDVGSVFGTVPVGTFVNLATNNWLVAVDLTYSGLAAGVPAVVTLVFNGLVVGAVGGVFDPVAFLALVAPHGIIEIPALVIGGAAGLSLGGVGIGALRGRYDDGDVAEAIRRTYRVLLGLVPLFVVAAFIEAFLTPAIASVVLGG